MDSGISVQYLETRELNLWKYYVLMLLFSLIAQEGRKQRRLRWDFRKHFLISKGQEKHWDVIWGLVKGKDFRRSKILRQFWLRKELPSWKFLFLIDWNKRHQQMLYLFAWSSRPLCSSSNACRNSIGVLLILVNWPVRTINPGESLFKNWWSIEIKRAKQIAAKPMNKWCFLS